MRGCFLSGLHGIVLPAAARASKTRIAGAHREKNRLSLTRAKTATSGVVPWMGAGMKKGPVSESPRAFGAPRAAPFVGDQLTASAARRHHPARRFPGPRYSNRSVPLSVPFVPTLSSRVHPESRDHPVNLRAAIVRRSVLDDRSMTPRTQRVSLEMTCARAAMR
jgi:hypothetical protein